jgi:hypothetical protein
MLAKSVLSARCGRRTRAGEEPRACPAESCAMMTSRRQPKKTTS